MADKDWINVKRVASMCGLNVSTLYDWARENRGPPHYRIGSIIRYDRREVSDWIEQQKRGI